MPVFTVTALLFDCDGVLVDSLDAAAVAWNEWGTRWKPGFDFHRDVEHGRRLTDFVAELVGPEDAAEAAAELAALEREHAVDVHEIPGAAALLANLPAGSWAVVTSGTRDIATARLTAAGIPTPAVLVTADDVATGKPSPDPYLLAAQRLELPPHDCAVFEDAPAGVTAAQRAGVRTIIGVGTDVTMPGVSATVRDLRGISFDGARLCVGEYDTSPQDQT
jgi:mannitol-1-/sugar-/sorbitol-6-phosphatase